MPDTVDAALLIVRVAVGLVFLAHGIKHFRNREKTMQWTQSIGFKSPAIQWMFMSFAEIGVGLSLILGFLTAVGAAGVAALMVPAFWTVHRHAGFWITARPDEGWEYVFVLTAAAAALALLGAGEWSIDNSLDIVTTFDATTGALIFAGGVAAAIGQLAMFFRPTKTTTG